MTAKPQATAIAPMPTPRHQAQPAKSGDGIVERPDRLGDGASSREADEDHEDRTDQQLAQPVPPSVVEPGQRADALQQRAATR